MSSENIMQFTPLFRLVHSSLDHTLPLLHRGYDAVEPGLLHDHNRLNECLTKRPTAPGIRRTMVRRTRSLSSPSYALAHTVL